MNVAIKHPLTSRFAPMPLEDVLRIVAREYTSPIQRTDRKDGLSDMGRIVEALCKASQADNLEDELFELEQAVIYADELRDDTEARHINAARVAW
jgi:hypothetical protein